MKDQNITKAELIKELLQLRHEIKILRTQKESDINTIEIDQAEEALRESEGNYRKLFTEMMDGFAVHEIICDDEGNAIDYITLEVNHTYESLLKVSCTDVVGRRASEILPQQELKKWLDIFAPVALTGISTRYETYSPQNNKYFIGLAYCPEKGKFAVTFSDITNRKNAEDKLKEKMTELERFNKIMTGREMRMIELKQEVNALCEQVGIPKKYQSPEGN